MPPMCGSPLLLADSMYRLNRLPQFWRKRSGRKVYGCPPGMQGESWKGAPSIKAAVGVREESRRWGMVPRDLLLHHATFNAGAYIWSLFIFVKGFPGGAGVKEPTCQCRSHKRRGLDSWVGKIPWRRAWQPTPVSLPGESHRRRSLAGCNPSGDMTEVT